MSVVGVGVIRTVRGEQVLSTSEGVDVGFERKRKLREDGRDGGIL